MTDRITTEEVERIAGENEREGVLAGEDGRMWGSRRTVELGERLIACAAVIRSLAAERDRLREAILWALGERGEFPPRGDGDPPYGWRKELRRRAALGENQP